MDTAIISGTSCGRWTLFLNFGNADSSSVMLFYRTFDSAGTEKLRLKKKPSSIKVEGQPIAETLTGEGYTWTPMRNGGGLLVIRRQKGRKVILLNDHH